MKLKHKLFSLLKLSIISSIIITCINKIINLLATSKNLLFVQNAFCYRWRLGNVHYTKIGSGNPILLIHDLTPASSSYEWSQMVQKLKNHYTVYTIDLLGFGRSEKSAYTYTNYLYVQLISDFIKSEIGHRTNIIATGSSSSIIIMACNNNPDLFDKIMLINPCSISEFNQFPGKYAKIFKFMLDLPVIGTLLYHIAVNRSFLIKTFATKYFYNPYSVKPSYIQAYYESAHLGKSPQSTFASIECQYIKASITSALKKINNSIFIVGSTGIEQMKQILEEYKYYNSSIEYILIEHARLLPQLEKPNDILHMIQIFFG